MTTIKSKAVFQLNNQITGEVSFVCGSHVKQLVRSVSASTDGCFTLEVNCSAAQVAEGLEEGIVFDGLWTPPVLWAVYGKGGREFEGCYTTEERAEAAMWKDDTYMGIVVREVEEYMGEETFAEVQAREIASDEADEMDMQWSTLDSYRAFCKGAELMRA